MTRFDRSRTLIVGLSLLFILTTSLPVPAALKIEKKPASIQRKTFDPANRPKEMPELHPGEEAVCTYNFDLQSGVSVEMRKLDLGGGKFKVVYTIRAVSGTLGLDLTIWVPEGASAKLKAHEEGHRDIAETAYKTADVIAKKLADKIDGRRVEGAGATWEEAEKLANAEVKKLNDQFNNSYIEQVSKHAQNVQVMYDDLTGHGVKPQPDEKEAARLAWAKFGPPGPAPTTKPAVGGPATKPSRQ